MKLNLNALNQHLQGPLASVYLITSDEALLVIETRTRIIETAKQQGFTERTVFHMASNSDWHAITTDCLHMSLFSEKRIMDIRLASGKPGDKGGKALRTLAETPPQDTLLILTLPKVDRALMSRKWFKAWEEQGVVIQLWPLNANEFKTWVQQRLTQASLTIEPQALALLCDYVAGNLLAAHQAVMLLELLLGEGGVVNENTIRDALSMNQHSVLFDLSDALLQHNVSHALNKLYQLRNQGVAENLILWLISQTLQRLAQLAYAKQTGGDTRSLLSSWRLPLPQQQKLERRASMKKPQFFLRGLQQASMIDQMLKGARAGNTWDAFAKLCQYAAS